MNKLEKILFQLFVFLIPSNLFLKWAMPGSYVTGFLVDYLIPKLYLSDIFILLLLSIWLMKDWRKLWDKIYLNKTHLVIISLVFAIFVRGLLSYSPLASIWYFLKIIELTLFFYWMRVNLSFVSFKKLTFVPLSLAILLQSFLGIYQFVAQKSLAGYWFLGETTLSLSSQIDKVSILGRLFIPAYGTAAHSNVLGGFLALGLLMLVYLYKNSSLKKFVIFMGIVCLLLTFSITSWIGFLLGLLIYKTRLSELTLSGIAIFPLLSPILLIFLSKFFDSISILRRIELLKISWKVMVDNLLLGVGLNNFTSAMSNYGTVIANTRFLQPVHNVTYLFITESGLVGILLLILAVYSLLKRNLANIGLFVVLVWLGTFDHYLLTLQTGQLLSILVLYIVTTAGSSLYSE